MTLGDLSKEDVEGIRIGAIADPTVSQVVALAAVFGVEPSYLLDRREASLDGELVEVLRDGTVREAAREIERPHRRGLGRREQRAERNGEPCHQSNHYRKQSQEL